ncbi:MAG: DUF454 family protein [Bacillota bacterium]|jgi:uncharacterized membrane protein YbaN (DUF454 family)
MRNQTLKKYLLLVGGSLSLALGCLGIFLPLLPTTPFLLLTAYCYLHSSSKAHAWLMQHRVLGNYINTYLSQGKIPAIARTCALLLLWLSLSLAIYLVSDFVVKLLLLGVGLGVSIHLFTLKTCTATEAEQVGTAPAAGSEADDFTQTLPDATHQLHTEPDVQG